MCKTGKTPKRPTALITAEQQQEQFLHHVVSQCSPTSNLPVFQQQPSFQQQHQQGSYFPQFFNPTLMQLGSMPQQPPQPEPSQLFATQSFYRPNMPPLNSPPMFHNQLQNGNPWFQQSRPHMLVSSQSTMDLLSRPSMGSTPLPSPSIFNTSLRDIKSHFQSLSPSGHATCNMSAPSIFKVNSQAMIQETQLPSLGRKRPVPEPTITMVDYDDTASEGEKPERPTPAKKARATKKKHEATLDGERRVAIEFESVGTLGVLPQTYGKGALLVPDGVCGKYSAFGQRWKFTISHAVGPVICEDGIQRMCLSWSVTNLNSGQVHSAIETPSDAMKRDRDGKTLCNRVFRDALSLRSSALEAEMRSSNDPSLCVDLQSQLRTIQTKRFSEGPLFFGLRHCTLQNEMKKELEKRKGGEEGAPLAATSSDSSLPVRDV